MAKPNYAFAKRQRELAKKQKLEEKRQRKNVGGPATPEDGSPDLSEPGAAPAGSGPGSDPVTDGAQSPAAVPVNRQA